MPQQVDAGPILDRPAGFFPVKLPMRCQHKLDQLTAGTRLSRPKVIELLLDLARMEDLVVPALQRQSEVTTPEPAHA